MTNQNVINIGLEFSRFLVGRYLADGDSNGQRFRDDWLVPALVRGGAIEILLDDALGYGSSFLEEAFGGLVRLGYKKDDLLKRLILKTEDESLKKEIVSYIEEAVPPKG